MRIYLFIILCINKLFNNIICVYKDKYSNNFAIYGIPC